jgi:monomeric isocitrate dehydrogenase
MSKSYKKAGTAKKDQTRGQIAARKVALYKLVAQQLGIYPEVFYTKQFEIRYGDEEEQHIPISESGLPNIEHIEHEDFMVEHDGYSGRIFRVVASFQVPLMYADWLKLAYEQACSDAVQAGVWRPERVEFKRELREKVSPAKALASYDGIDYPLITVNHNQYKIFCIS